AIEVSYSDPGPCMLEYIAEPRFALTQLRFRLLTLGDILSDARNEIPNAQRCAVVPYPPDRPVRPEYSILAVILPSINVRIEIVLHPVAIFFMKSLKPGLKMIVEALQIHAPDIFKRLTRVDEFLLYGIGDPKHIADSFHQRAESQFALAQGFFSAFALGNVDEDPREANGRTGGIIFHPPSGDDPAAGTV